MAIQTLPQNAVQSWTNLSRVVDDIWFYTGDQSNDVSYYGDRSEDYTDTWNFLENRLEDVVSAGHIGRNLQETNKVLSEGAKGFCVMTRNLLGMNNR
uniref:Ubiquinone biosynthesis protein n=1 Tax=Magallana gigas TaxID=29159 RepID=A0A8W8JB95_MAGGI